MTNDPWRSSHEWAVCGKLFLSSQTLLVYFLGLQICGPNVQAGRSKKYLNIQFQYKFLVLRYILTDFNYGILKYSFKLTATVNEVVPFTFYLFLVGKEKEVFLFFKFQYF